MSEIFDEVFKLMEISFPKEEYRSYEDQKKLLDIPMYSITTKIENGNLIGFICSWKTDNFSFIEHFAVNPLMRGKGVGSKMLNEFINNSAHPIILEVELPDNEMNIRRIKFYQKFGFILNNFKYYQMPLRKGFKPIEMNLMSYPKILNADDFENTKTTIHKNIYSIT